MKSLYLPFLILCLAMPTAQGQSLKAYKKAAVEAEESRNYSVALANYEVIIKEAGKTTAHNYYRAAESARMMKVYPLAEEYYKRVLASEQKMDYPLSDYWLGVVLKQQGKYDEAKSAYQKYLEGSGASGGDKAEKAQQELIDCDWAKAVVQDEKPVEIKHLGPNVNTPNTEIAPMLKGDELYFSSLRESHADGFCAFPTTRIYKSKAGADGTMLDASFSTPNKHTAHSTFSTDGKTMYYTLCETPAPDTTRCAIYSRTQANDGTWGAAHPLPKDINFGNYTATQPNVGRDNINGKELLFFVSDRPGGTGGLDIWCSYIEANGSFGAPYNIAAINTSEDDITPFFYSDFQTLYFSSQGMQNLGGFDIFYTQKEIGGWSTVKHGGYPLNSSYDDTYFSINSEAQKAHFSSNRPGSICADTSNYCICSDIYEMAMPEVKVEVLTFNEITRDPLNGTKVELDNPTNTSFQKQVFSKEEDHQYNEYEVSFGKSYQLDATKKGYSNSVETFVTPLPLFDTTIVIHHYLRPIVDLNVQTFDRLSGAELTGVKVDLIAMPTVDLLVSQREEFGHEYHYPLDYKKRYMVIGTKTCYNSDTAYVDSNVPVEPKTFNRELRLEEKILPDFLNVDLFFDNDQPGPRNKRARTTDANYKDKYLDYIADYDERKGYYKNDKAHTPEMDQFFTNKAKKGFEDLEKLANDLHNYFNSSVNNKDHVLVTIRGFASLRASKEYNEALASRRISSVQKYFNNWVDPTGQKSLNGRIKVTEAPLGELEDRKGLYPENAIAHPFACEDRRVEIIDIQVDRDPCDKTKK